MGRWANAPIWKQLLPTRPHQRDWKRFLYSTYWQWGGCLGPLFWFQRMAHAYGIHRTRPHLFCSPTFPTRKTLHANCIWCTHRRHSWKSYRSLSNGLCNRLYWHTFAFHCSDYLTRWSLACLQYCRQCNCHWTLLLPYPQSSWFSLKNTLDILCSRLNLSSTDLLMHY